MNLYGQTSGGATRIYTDYNGYWTSGVGAINPIHPDNSHNLTAFTWAGTTYSTGVDDDQLVASGVTFSPSIFQAFPVRNIGSTSGTYIGLGQLYDGVDNGRSDPPPFPVPPNLANYLTDGLQGLDIGTGVANIAAGEVIFEFTGIIDANQINDGIPDILVSQIANPSSTTDEIYLSDSSGTMVGNSVNISHNTITRVGQWRADFYNLDGANTAFTNEDRDLRLWVAELSAFGINLSNYDQVTSMRYKLNGTSDPAFAAFKVGVFDILSANNDFADTDQEEEVEIDVLQNDQPEASLDPGSVSIINEPLNGSLTINYITGNIVYKPDPGFYGTDVFTYLVCSNQSESALCDEAEVEVSVSSVILPIVLLHFSANMGEDKRVEVNWTTSAEKGSDYFEVQRSSNGMDWEIIEKIQASGHSSAIVKYSIKDHSAGNGYNYYRLVQVDFDGHFELSEVISLKIHSEIREEITIYPNPGIKEITLEGDPEELQQISLINTFGQNQTESMNITRISESRVLINLENIPSGLYVVRTRTFGRIFRKL